MITRRSLLRSGAAAAAALAGARAARAETPGVSDTEIRIGQTMPYSGPASAYGVIGKADLAYFTMINDMGGINGRRVTLISLDDGYSPPKTVEQTRRLVEQEGVAFLFNSLGTAPCAAVRQYLNDNRIPQLFCATGASLFADPKSFPWTMGWQPNYRTEAGIFGKYIARTKPDAKVAILTQNDGFGKDYLIGLKDGLGPERVGQIVAAATYETSEPTVDSQIVTLQGSGADVFVIAATPKFAAQAIRKAYDVGWTPLRLVTDVSQSIASVMKPAGVDKAKGVVTAVYGKDPTDARWADDPGFKAYAEFIAKYMSPKDLIDSNAVYGFGATATMVQVLRQCGGDLTRENVMRQAASLKDFVLPMTLPGISINTSADNFTPIRQEQLATFDGQGWRLFGELLAG
ncbi:amino acid/amide ABC transporter substrate-binding protein (HAAT family) [Roseiarcus fermentans]|uniref:Amino acid/amide ABC transporter substrate-binding protein (HAAT family) n=1 Tax=Roseiarcus fermentans TaxID=1473586 RepID=A0A366EFD5_9HYPH|nr:ABC transporter substrate-binding protein [Roseiarcus fermentans]RBP01043.1 amino acid/amide ABC transporter substrate-binding protein (HAAT family) [Roseiarcus fermentans]